jgi:hypothetical protein
LIILFYIKLGSDPEPIQSNPIEVSMPSNESGNFIKKFRNQVFFLSVLYIQIVLTLSGKFLTTQKDFNKFPHCVLIYWLFFDLKMLTPPVKQLLIVKIGGFLSANLCSQPPVQW